MYFRASHQVYPVRMLRLCGIGICLIMIFAFGVMESAYPQHQARPTTPRPSDYLISANDILQIDIWMHPELSRTVRVAADGTITAPLLNHVNAAGLSAVELASMIRDKLKPLIDGPQITVTVTPSTVAPAPEAPSKSIRKPDTPSPDLRQPCCTA